MVARATTSVAMLDAAGYTTRRERNGCPPHRAQEAEQRRGQRLTLVAAVLLLGGLAAFGVLLWRTTLFPGAGEGDGEPNQARRRGRRGTPKNMDDPWLKQVAALPAEKQAAAVAVKLKELNPEFDGKWSAPPRIEKGVVTGLKFVSDNVKDISPMRALSGLTSLNVAGSVRGRGGSRTCTPLKDMKLTYLDCNNTQVGDLSPLKGMPLTVVLCGTTRVADLSPLKGMPLTHLNCGTTQGDRPIASEGHEANELEL